MVNVSTLYYVLENLEGKSEDLIDLDEVSELENTYLKDCFSILDNSGIDVRPSVVEKLLQKAREI